ncbi:U-actitoxin-Avd3q-like [Anastrepha obliqua]|uniref:U-actitoxin-Avd3q-like n=1 Tax=Anastrepha obliqua TaxID=95512 RepID=UPI00240A7617|nr:U-actitoxin-Avd3q-like [Anastrepha obliqua]
MSNNNALSFEKFGFLQLRSVVLLLLLLLLLFSAQEINADSSYAVNRSVAACKMPRIPLLCDSKLLRYAYNAATGKCVSLYTNNCGTNAMSKHFLTFEECRRDRMKILRY